MKVCWICEVPIPPGQASKDHVIPRSKLRPETRGVMRWADRDCNSARGSMAVEDVEAIKAQGLSQFALRFAMIEQQADRWQPRVNKEACEQ